MGRKRSKPKKRPHRISDEKLIAGMQKDLDGKYGKILAAARRKWEREFGAKADPSDAAAKVRVSLDTPKPPASASE